MNISELQTNLIKAAHRTTYLIMSDPSANTTAINLSGGPDVTGAMGIVHNTIQEASQLLGHNYYESNESLKDGCKTAVDISMGDVLDLNKAQFEKFCAGENLTNPVYRALFEYRTTMIQEIEKIFGAQAGV